MSDRPIGATPEFWKIRDDLERLIADLKAYRGRWPGPDPQLDELAALDAELVRLTRRLGLRVVTSEEDEP